MAQRTDFWRYISILVTGSFLKRGMSSVIAAHQTDIANHDADELRALNPSGNTAADRAHRVLLSAIVGLELRPGERLMRKALSGRLGVSQTPLREALLRLERQGLIETRPQSETRVSFIDRRGLFELHFQRVALETEVVRRLARARVADTCSLAEAADTSFHAGLFQAVGMLRVFDDLMTRYPPMQRCLNALPHDEQKACIGKELQLQICDRIDAKDAKGAVLAMRALLSDEAACIGDVARLHPDWFR